MRHLGYYTPTEQEFKDLWQGATFVLDANVLLNIYGYSHRTRVMLLGLLKSIEKRLWVPYQFSLEYQRNRIKAISDQVASYSSARREIKKLLDEQFKVNHRHPFVSRKSLSAVDAICAELSKGEKEHQKLYSTDPYFAAISEILEGRIGVKPTSEQLMQRYEEAGSRYKNKTPPGYADAPPKKPEPDAYGDYLGWYELLEHAAAGNHSTILVTDDRKEDWWFIHNKDRRLGPRPELVAEHKLKTGNNFYMYSLEEFLRHAQQHLGQRVTTAALQEVRERSEAFEDSDASETPKPTSSTSDAKPTTPTVSILAWDDGAKMDGRPNKPDIR